MAITKKYMNPERSEQFTFAYNNSSEGRPPESEVVVNPETTPILAGMLEIRDEGREANAFLVDQILSGRRKKAIFMGEPGIGKTSLLVDTKKSVEENGRRQGMPVKIKTRFYDEYLARAESLLGPRDGWRVDREWKYLNDYIVGDLSTSEREKDDERLFVELPGVGLTTERDRAVTAISKLLQNATPTDKNDTLFVFVVCNNFLQLNSSFLRTHILEQKDEDVVAELEKHNQRVDLVGEPEVIGRLVKKLYKKTAPSRNIAQIRREEEEKIGRWRSALEEKRMLDALQENPHASRDANLYKESLEERMQGMHVSPQVSRNKMREVFRSYNVDDTYVRLRTNSWIDKANTQAVYMEEMFRNRYGLDKDTAMIVYNPYVSRPLVIDSSLLKR